jgi:curved DNA-binding protein CbpA
MSRTFYEVLGVNANADASAIRKAYLRASLQHHPDKNLDDVEGAKARFVEIGQAYETLSDSVQRSQYDRDLKSGGGGNSKFRSSTSNAGRTSGGGGGGGGSSASASSPPGADYDNYRDFFDTNVAGMSEAELAACLGTVAVIASVVGSMVGGRLAGGGKPGILATMGSLAGSMVASQLAQESVLALQESSKLRLAYKDDCQRAMERGQPMPEKPRNEWEEKLKESWSFAKKQTQQATNSQNSTTTSDRDGQQQSRSGGDSKINMGDLWRQATAGVKAATNSTTSNGHPQQQQQQQQQSRSSDGQYQQQQQQSRSSGESNINMGDLWRQAAAGVKAAAELTKNTNASRR